PGSTKVTAQSGKYRGGRTSFTSMWSKGGGRLDRRLVNASSTSRRSDSPDMSQVRATPYRCGAPWRVTGEFAQAFAQAATSVHATTRLPARIDHRGGKALIPMSRIVLGRSETWFRST